ncbi:hypothetical protein EMPS_08321 [Entomortierella parvispora]|uniref:Transmembrane protein n=1 Tax=Entomortierella parvispora TaxID=205924 RepID=A0A9P3HGH8_9FUNG|nr:hypothetical protein EMPS_08321 [Entomortierella parvispora]
MDSSEMQFKRGKRRQSHDSTFNFGHTDEGHDLEPPQPYRTIRQRRPARHLSKRQQPGVEEPTLSGILTPSSTAWVTSSISLPAITSISTDTSGGNIGATPTPTNTSQVSGHAPLESLPVQLILGCLGGFIILVVTLRCAYVNRQNRALAEARARRSNMSLAQRHARALAATGNTGRRSNMVPTNAPTLAARLNAYQQIAESRRYVYPYQQEPIGAAAGGDGAFSSVVSFVAPSYQHDVSPPPFMVDAGKPPAYAAAIATAVETMRGVAPPNDAPPRPVSPASPNSPPVPDHTAPLDNSARPTDTPEVRQESRESS